MAQYSQTALQLVAENQNVLFTETQVRGNKCIMHRDGSGIVTLKAGNARCRALYLVSFNGNIAVPTGGTVGEISLAISIEGEALGSATMVTTPTVVEAFENVAATVVVPVPVGCCVTISVRNTSDQPINIENANLVIGRIA